MSAADPSELPVLRASGLAKDFPSGREKIEVLRGVDLAVPRGRFVSIRGQSGGGKTTLLNILAGLEAPSAGTVHWGDRALPQNRLSTLAPLRAATIGMVFQNFYLVPELNALENVLLAARVARRPLAASAERARALLEEVGLGHRLHAPPAHLSGGERQRVALARALVNQPAAVLADEPTGNLDESSSDRVMDILLAACRSAGAALLLVTHSRAHAARADDAWVLTGGRLQPA